MTLSDDTIEEAIRYKLYVLERTGLDLPDTLDEFVAQLHLAAPSDNVRRVFRQMKEEHIPLPAYG